MSPRLILAACALCALPLTGRATETCVQDAMLVFDGSGSMTEMGFNRVDTAPIVDARLALRRSLPRIEKIRKLGLIIYGPGVGESCKNIDLRFAPIERAAARILSDVDALRPGGMTALTASVLKAAEVLEFRTRPATVVLVTDGKETCGGAPCALAAELMTQAKDLTVHVIGFKVRADFFSWGSPEQSEQDRFRATTVAVCLAERTGGQYVTAETVDDLSNALEQTLGCQVIGQLHRAGGRRSRS